MCADCLSLSLQTVVSAFASLSRFCFSCQPFCFHSIIEPLIIVDSGCNSKSSTSGDLAKTGRPATLVRKLRKINQSSIRRIEKRPSQFWLTKNRFFGSCNGIVLCGIPYRGRGALASPHPTNRLLFPLGLGYPIELGCSRSSTALKQLSESIIVRSHLQARVQSFFGTR